MKETWALEYEEIVVVNWDRGASDPIVVGAEQVWVKIIWDLIHSITVEGILYHELIAYYIIQYHYFLSWHERFHI